MSGIAKTFKSIDNDFSGFGHTMRFETSLMEDDTRRTTMTVLAKDETVMLVLSDAHVSDFISGIDNLRETAERLRVKTMIKIDDYLKGNADGQD